MRAMRASGSSPKIRLLAIEIGERSAGASVDRSLPRCSGTPLGPQGHERLHPDRGDENAEGSPRETEHEAFRQHLAGDASAGRSQRGADGDLPRAPGAAREEHVRDVGAGDEQHQADGSEEDPQSLLVALHEDVPEAGPRRTRVPGRREGTASVARA